MEYKNILYLIFIISFIFYNRNPKFNKKISLKYNDIKNNLDTGDIILFSCNATFSNFIKKISNSIFTHCGIIIKLYNKLFILECDFDDEYDYITSSYKKGVHLVNLEKKINMFGNLFCYRKLKGNKLEKKKLTNIIKKTYFYQFELNIIKLILNYIGLNLFKSKNKMMCSEYISYVYYKIGVLKKINFSKCLPKFFCNNNITLNNFYFDKLIFFKK